MIADLKQYKLAKIFLKDIAVILAHIDAAILQLEPYRWYKSVADTLRSLRDNKTILLAHQAKYKAILKNKASR